MNTLIKKIENLKKELEFLKQLPPNKENNEVLLSKINELNSELDLFDLYNNKLLIQLLKFQENLIDFLSQTKEQSSPTTKSFVIKELLQTFQDMNKSFDLIKTSPQINASIRNTNDQPKKCNQQKEPIEFKVPLHPAHLLSFNIWKPISLTTPSGQKSIINSHKEFELLLQKIFNSLCLTQKELLEIRKNSKIEQTSENKKDSEKD